MSERWQGIPGLDPEALLNRAREAAGRAYAPYSGFPVGAALLAGSGRIYAGCNVESGCTNLGICAERGALAQAIEAGERRFLALAVVAPRAPSGGCPPCGACLQVLAEFGGDLLLLWPGEGGSSESGGSEGGRPRTLIGRRLRELLPAPFCLPASAVTGGSLPASPGDAEARGSVR